MRFMETYWIRLEIAVYAPVAVPKEDYREAIAEEKANREERIRKLMPGKLLIVKHCQY